MDRHAGSAILCALVLAAWAGDCLASESLRVRVSCTIPAIPGVNVPLIAAGQAEAEQQEAAPKEPDRETEPSPADAGTQDKDKIEESEKQETMMVRTVYSR